MKRHVMAYLPRGGVVALLASGMLVAGCSTTLPTEQVTADAVLISAIDSVDIEAFTDQNPGHGIDVSREPGMESISIANYDLTKPPPSRQDVVSYGMVGSSEETRDQVVVSVAVQDGTTYYVAEFDPDSHDMLLEDGTWFLPESRDSYLQRQLALMDDLLTT